MHNTTATNTATTDKAIAATNYCYKAITATIATPIARTITSVTTTTTIDNAKGISKTFREW